MLICRTCFIFPLMAGSPSVYLNSSLADRHFLPLVPLPILERVVGGSYDCEHCNDRSQELER
jgi:hypothetical protein